MPAIMAGVTGYNTRKGKKVAALWTVFSSRRQHDAGGYL